MTVSEAEMLQKAQANWLHAIRITFDNYEVDYIQDKCCCRVTAFFTDGTTLKKEFTQTPGYRIVQTDPALWKALSELEEEKNK